MEREEVVTKTMEALGLPMAAAVLTEAHRGPQKPSACPGTRSATGPTSNLLSLDWVQQMNEAHILIEKVIEIIVSERKRTTLEVKSGSVADETSQEEILSMAKNAIFKIAKLKRIESMLGDVETLLDD